MTNAQERFSLAELTEAAGVSVRTVRYYISEGLLPPPVGSGPKSYYTRSHFDRLRAIGRMRANYLPLREIRRRLGAMSDQQIRALATEETAEAEEAAETAVVAAE
ncbi:MAG TPA: MerR family transcriptional regulator, partial [Thermomicrobiales bacterium]|nr:MerR family transcriptional regulator [Thermomicrobiales bacterium]